MHDINFILIIHFYIDALKYEAKFTMTQFQMRKLTISIIKILILYDSFIFFFTQKLYFTYKKKLCAIIKFVCRYDYLCKHFYNFTIIHIDHRSLIYFLKSNLHEKIYDYWTNKLRRLNIIIQYISNHRNKTADELLKIIFNDECDELEQMMQ